MQVAHPESSHKLAVVGPSGSGKSLTLRTLAGLLQPDAAAISYGGVDVTDVPAQNRHVGYVPQGLGLIPGKTVWQQVMFGAQADASRAAWWLDKLHLDELTERYPEQLSGGQRQRVSLARALAPDPRLVLLDEPFSALDAPVRQELRRELRMLQREAGLSTVLVTHDPEEAAFLADEILVAQPGSGPPVRVGSRDVYRRLASSSHSAAVGTAQRRRRGHRHVMAGACTGSLLLTASRSDSRRECRFSGTFLRSRSGSWHPAATLPRTVRW